jgi:hypothetical protein
MMPRRRQTPWPPIGPTNPFEVGVLVIGTVNGSCVLAGAATPMSMSLQLSERFLMGWAWLLLAGSVVALVGLLWRGDWVTGVEIKRPGLVAFSLACLAYSYAAARLGGPGMAVATVNGGFSVIAWWRIAQVTRGIRDYRRNVAVVRPNPRR